MKRWLEVALKDLGYQVIFREYIENQTHTRAVVYVHTYHEVMSEQAIHFLKTGVVKL